MIHFHHFSCMKGRLYASLFCGSAVLYSSETWVVEDDIKRLKHVNHHILRWICNTVMRNPNKCGIKQAVKGLSESVK